MSRSGARKPVGGKKGASDRKVADHPSMAAQDADEFALPETLHIIPEDQVKLTPKEMEEDITR